MENKMKKQILGIIIVFLLIISGCKTKKEIELSPEERGSAKLMYEKAKKYMRRNSEKARLLFKEIIQIYPDSIYAGRAKIGIADSYFKQKDSAALIIAASEYQEYVNLYPNLPDAVYAKYQVGMCYYKQIKKPERDQSNTFLAIKAFESLVKQYPDTRETEDAKKKIAEARQNLASHYFAIGYYNYKYHAPQGAINRFKQVMNEYPEFKKNDKLFFLTGKSYYKLRNYDAAISFFQKIINSFPKSKYLKKSKKMIKKISKIKPKKVVKK